ncbi:hypothetical protein [Exiguobacterium antarcticum]|uniref:hypothetical protein n=1 Tax=Exiguobacterium antarcticum TaxID=132920 RepID=UPI000285EBDF|nr:hypothetical protein [Exiguobacterium antarcticum]AFS70342.1 Hypothetical protein Eab7_1207 [Exiguobacterium antarcticum B7]
MRKFLLIGFVIIIIAFFVEFEPFRDEPPDPRVEIQGKSVPTVQGTFCWSGMFSGQCVDKIYVDGLHMTEKSKPVTVMPNEKIQNSFDPEPDTIKILRFNKETGKPVTLKNNQLVTPKKAGTYAYELQARWSENGDGQFAFLIKVD